MPRRKVVRLLLVLVALALVPVGVYLYRTWRDSRRLQDLLAELDRTEPGWRLSDMEASQPAIPDARNAALVMKRVRLPSPHKVHFELEDSKLQPNQALTPLQTAKLREYLDEHQPHLLEARRLADFPAGSFSVKIAPDFISTALPHVQDTREIAHLLHMDIVWQAQQAVFEQVPINLEASRNAGRSIRDDPFLISQLVRLAVLNQSIAMLERVLAQGQPAPKLLGRMQEALANEPTVESWYTAIAGERAGIHEMFQRLDGKINMRLLRGMTGMSQRWHDNLTDLVLPWTAQESHVWVLRNLTEQLATRELPLAERRAKLDALAAEAAQAPLLAQVLLTSPWRKSYEGFVRAEAKLAAACAGLAAERFRQEKGRWPKTLQELVPDWLAKVPLDPYDQAPLRYRPTPDGVVIYSVGPEGKLKGEARDNPEAQPPPDPAYEFRLWDVDQRRRPGKDR
jgi:hypothetical protein